MTTTAAELRRLTAALAATNGRSHAAVTAASDRLATALDTASPWTVALTRLWARWRLDEAGRVLVREGVADARRRRARDESPT